MITMAPVAAVLAISIDPQVVIIGILASCCGASAPLVIVGAMFVLAFRHAPKFAFWDAEKIHRALHAVDKAREELLRAEAQLPPASEAGVPSGTAVQEGLPMEASETATAAVGQLRAELPALSFARDWLPLRTKLVIAFLRNFLWYAVTFALGVVVSLLIMHLR